MFIPQLDGDFATIGDFTSEEGGSSQPCNERVTPPSNSSIIRGLLDRDCALQVKTSKQYAKQFVYFDRVTALINEMLERHKLFAEWKGKRLAMWQFTILEKILTQNSRKILWMVDTVGNHGKTFLSNYMSILYDFQYLDGSINCRDLAMFLRPSTKGIVFDVCRSAMNLFDYATLEAMKNGVIVSGKYRGIARRLTGLPIVVFSNSHPKLDALSLDRWDIVVAGQGILSNIDSIPMVSPEERFPFVNLPPLPELLENFDLKEFLDTRLKDPYDACFTEIQNPTYTGFSQVAGQANPLPTDPNNAGTTSNFRK